MRMMMGYLVGLSRQIVAEIKVRTQQSNWVKYINKIYYVVREEEIFLYFSRFL